jgi:hypothetical protein
MLANSTQGWLTPNKKSLQSEKYKGGSPCKGNTCKYKGTNQIFNGLFTIKNHLKKAKQPALKQIQYASPGEPLLRSDPPGKLQKHE